jgi:3-oxoacyl-(acyl-carrier-protein) synthase
MRTAFGDMPPLLLLKPFTGHTLGACGLLDVALIAAALPEVPGNLPGITGVPDVLPKLHSGDTLLKIASGMGGHNAVVELRVG